MTPEGFRDLFVALLVIFVMLSVGLDLRLRDVTAVFRRPRLVGSCLAWEHLAMPLVALGVVQAFGLGAPEGIALILCAATPGGPIGPIFVQQARGTLALGVALVVLMGTINVVSTPLTLKLVGARPAGASGFVGHLVKTIALYQLVPLAVGMVVRARDEAFARRALRSTDATTRAILGMLVVGMLLTQWHLVLDLGARTVAAILTLCALSVAGGYFAALGDRADRRALASISGIRNLGLGLLVATASYSDATVMAVMIYGLLMLVVVAPVTFFWRRHA